MSVNKVILIGRLGKDPELKNTASGSSVCSFSLATSKKYKDKEQTQWHNVVAFGKLAEICGKYLQKGRQAYIDGEIRYEEYEKDGVKKYITKIIANEVSFLNDAKEKRENEGYQDSGKVTYEDVAKAFGGTKEDIKVEGFTNEEIPF